MIEPAALNLQRLEYSLVLLREGTKEARFPAYQKRGPPTRAEIQYWMRKEKLNIAILLQGLTIIDIDGPDGREFADKQGWVSPMVTLSSRGEHRYFQGRAVETNIIKYKGLMLDILVNGFITAPPSLIADTEWRYEFKRGPVRKGDLPVAPKIEVPKKEIVLRNFASVERPSLIRNPANYCLTIEANQGQYGSKAHYRVACILRDAGWTAQKAFEWMMEVWGPKCAHPEFSAKETAHTVSRVFQEPL